MWRKMLEVAEAVGDAETIRPSAPSLQTRASEGNCGNLAALGLFSDLWPPTSSPSVYFRPTKRQSICTS